MLICQMRLVRDIKHIAYQHIALAELRLFLFLFLLLFLLLAGAVAAALIVGASQAFSNS